MKVVRASLWMATLSCPLSQLLTPTDTRTSSRSKRTENLSKTWQWLSTPPLSPCPSPAEQEPAELAPPTTVQDGANRAAGIQCHTTVLHCLKLLMPG